MSERPATGTRPERPTPRNGAEAVHYGRLSGVLGAVFAGLLVAALVLVHRSPGLGATDAAYDTFYADGGQTVLITVGLYLVPFAGIAFLWHMTTTRLLVRELVPEPPAIPLGLHGLAGGLFVGAAVRGRGGGGRRRADGRHRRRPAALARGRPGVHRRRLRAWCSSTASARAACT